MAALRHFAIVVRDQEKSAKFYEGVFGLKLKFRDGAKWAQFDGGNVSFALSSPEESASAEGGAASGRQRRGGSLHCHPGRLHPTREAGRR